VFSGKAKDFISKQKENPFFLFFSYHDIHVPRIPSQQFAGKSPMGARGDAIAQMDWTTRQVVAHLKTLNLLENTLIIFTSDNGPVLNDGYEDMADKLVGNHKPGGPFRGGKYSAFEAGTRVPMIVAWKGKIAPQKSEALINQVDLYRSIASLIGVSPGETEAIDSEDHSSALLGKSGQARTWMLEESYSLSVRKNNWKYIAPVNGDKKVPAFMANKGIESGLAKVPQLYDLSADPGEQKNLANSLPQVVSEMQQYLKSVVNKKQ
jgi:arylsulfatase A